ncbi:TPA: hypothetical protein I8627_004361 [Citrobacter freundii]|uniref:Uncharacterized protein n=2 Tax=Enterobacter cloacae complex TaxID=354276 RepID=A0ABC9UGU6_ENTAS|nr:MULTISPECIES: hypothetical protein [Enterobacteriaceae]AWS80630.1 hypothetical protein AM401_20245 [Enterobacter cloacae complex sp.]EAT1459552.1 hypothetical protein [Salmonella enterica]ELE9694181.1 hypothetical protein [Enterobacter kobei]MCU2454965.1 hypothetical protein [Enterobacter hormaechei subsp. hoffmannii]HDS6391797.1 hypothetical protein [Escherichia coli]
MTDIFDVLGPLFRKLTETCIAHQIAETGSATLLVESDKYMARYRFTLEPVTTYNVLAKFMVFGCVAEFGRDECLTRLRDILLTCFTDDGDISEMGLQIVKSCHLEYLHEDLGADMSNKVLH